MTKRVIIAVLLAAILHGCLNNAKSGSSSSGQADKTTQAERLERTYHSIRTVGVGKEVSPQWIKSDSLDLISNGPQFFADFRFQCMGLLIQNREFRRQAIHLFLKGLSIDHFVPWSYVASDELWNLIPTVKSVNSSKSNNLPDWKVYFGRLAKTEYDAYLLVKEDAKAKHFFEKCARENLNSEDIRFRLYQSGQTREHFTGQLEEILLPVYESAKNMGFREWVYQR